MKEVIGIIIAILLFAFVAIMMIIIKNVQKLYTEYKNKNHFNLEKKDQLKCLKIEKLEEAQKFYNKPYKYKVTFEYIITHQEIELYVEEFDANEFNIEDEYIINHDEVVVFDIIKKLF